MRPLLELVNTTVLIFGSGNKRAKLALRRIRVNVSLPTATAIVISAAISMAQSEHNEVNPTDQPAPANAEAPVSSAPKFDLSGLIKSRVADKDDLFAEKINPKFIQVLKTIGFNRNYVRGEGSHLWDADGNRYLDLLSGYGMFNMGRNHPVIKQAIRDYLDINDPWKLQMGSSLLPALLAEKLLTYAPHLDKVQFANSGAECNEAALKFARCSTGRERIIYCERAFHGLTYGSLSLNGCDSFRTGFQTMLPGPVSIPLNDLDALERELKAHPTAAFFVEPVQGKGVHRADDEFLLGAQELCRKHGALLVLDEVQCGMGRTGKMFAYQHIEGLEPDMILVSKSLSGGMVPVGAVMYRDQTYKKVFSSLDRCVVHSSTFCQGGLAMTCGLAAFHVIESEGLIEKGARQSERLLNGLRAMIAKYELLHEVRGTGMMIGIELGSPKSLGLKSAWKLIHAADKGLFPQALIMPLLDKHRIITQVAGHNMDVIKLLPPLTMTDEDTDWFLSAFEDVLAECHKFPGPAWTTATHLLKFAATGKRS